MSKYYDATSIVQIIGCVFRNQDLLDDEKYYFSQNDFDKDFHAAVFGVIFNLHRLGVKNIELTDIHDYLNNHPKVKGIYEANKGDEYLLRCSENAKEDSFLYHYNRMKKMTVLRAYTEDLKMDITWLYDPNEAVNIKKIQNQETWLDNHTVQDIIDTIDKKIDSIKEESTYQTEDVDQHAGDNLLELLEHLKEVPDIGIPLYGGGIINRLTRGARLGKFYLRSAATGVGKSISMIADMVCIGCSKMWKDGQWISLGKTEPSLLIVTEQDFEEIQPLITACVSGVDVEKIQFGKYTDEEWERIVKASKIITEGQLYLDYIADFSLDDIERIIKRQIRKHNVKYIAFDYIHSSLKVLEEIASHTQGIKIREDNILFMLSAHLKEIALEYGVFIESATQLSGDYKSVKTPDQGLLRGAKAIADRIDYGCILLEPNEEDRDTIIELMTTEELNELGGSLENLVKLSVYKNRGNKWKNLYVWMKKDGGTCRFDPLFCTTWWYERIAVPELEIELNEESAF